MEKTLSVIAIVFAVSLAACQQKPANVHPVETQVESPLTQTTPVTGPTTVNVAKDTVAQPPTSGNTAKTAKAKKTTTPRLDDAIRRIERLENLAKKYGAPI